MQAGELEHASDSEQRAGCSVRLHWGAEMLILFLWILSARPRTACEWAQQPNPCHRCNASTDLVCPSPSASLFPSSNCLSGSLSLFYAPFPPISHWLRSLARPHSRCAKCHSLVEHDTNLLLLADGSPVCENCSYVCSSCGKSISNEAIVTGDESYHADCFRCKSCSTRIEELVFAKTSQGIYW